MFRSIAASVAEKYSARWLHAGLFQSLVGNLLVIVLLSTHRLWLILTSAQTGGDSGQIVRALATGLRFDAVIACLAILPLFALTVIASISGHAATLMRFGVLSFRIVLYAICLTLAINAGFFAEFGNQLDQRVLEIFTEADGALVQTIWQKHRPVQLLALALIMAILADWAFRVLPAHLLELLERRVRINAFPLFLVALVFLIYSGRGFTFGETPIRIRNAFVAQNMALNQLIPSPFATLAHALEDRTDGRSPVSVGDANISLGVLAAPTVAQAVSVAASPSDKQVRHVFIILLEGQHGFPLLPEYRSLDLFPGLSELARQALHVPRFIPSGNHTDNTLAAVITGLFVPDFNLFHETRALAPFSTSIAPQAKAQGYVPRFFYGGYPGWSRLASVVQGQGFAELVSAPDMPGATGNAWGVWDEHLFEKLLGISADVPSLNIVMTTTNHSPYDLPSAMQPAPVAAETVVDAQDADTLEVLRHEQYVDRQVTRFIRNAMQKFPDAVFIITGDHPAHAARYRLPASRPLDALTVPCLILGKGVSPRIELARGASHLDLHATALDLMTPGGSRYNSFGRSLLKPADSAFGIGHAWVVDAQSVLPVGRDAQANQQVGAPADAQSTRGVRLHGAVKTLSRLMVFGQSAH